MQNNPIHVISSNASENKIKISRLTYTVCSKNCAWFLHKKSFYDTYHQVITLPFEAVFKGDIFWGYHGIFLYKKYIKNQSH